MTVASYSSAQTFLQSGAVRPIAVTTAAPLAELPGVPLLSKIIPGPDRDIVVRAVGPRWHAAGAGRGGQCGLQLRPRHSRAARNGTSAAGVRSDRRHARPLRRTPAQRGCPLDAGGARGRWATAVICDRLPRRPVRASRLIYPKPLDMPASRLLQLAAVAGGIGLLSLRPDALTQPSAGRTRWWISPASGSGTECYDVGQLMRQLELVKAIGGRAAGWDLPWDEGTRALLSRPAAPDVANQRQCAPRRWDPWPSIDHIRLPGLAHRRARSEDCWRRLSIASLLPTKERLVHGAQQHEMARRPSRLNSAGLRVVGPDSRVLNARPAI